MLDFFSVQKNTLTKNSLYTQEKIYFELKIYTLFNHLNQTLISTYCMSKKSCPYLYYSESPYRNDETLTI